jgi:enamine deaminase RidA (YjgF/YER057c/UK114 family)
MSANDGAGNGPTFINPPTIGEPIGLYSHVARARAGTTYYIAGQVAVDSNGDLVGPDDLSAQLGQTFANIGGALEALKLNFANIAQMTTYLTQRAHIVEFYQARSLLFPALFTDGAYPPNTLLVVAGLVRPELLIEVSLIATA